MTPDNTLFGIAEGDVVHHYICQTGQELTEVTFDGHELNPPLEVGTAREGTRGAYLLGDDNQRTIYCLTPSTTLQDFIYHPEAWEWAEGVLSQLSLSTSPDTTIAALSSRTTKATILFFQGTSGGIQSVSTSGVGDWQLFGSLPLTEPANGGDICAIETNDGVIRVFYVQKDGSIHGLTRDGETWSDSPLTIPLPLSASPPTSIVALHSSFDDTYLLEITLNKSVYLYTPSDGTVERIGDAEGYKRRPRPFSK